MLRWTWRVTYYATSGIGTDRYPPFTLASAEYPATLEIEYPEQLNRWLVLVKSWLLAIPHYIIIGFFMGGGWFVSSDERACGRRVRSDRVGHGLRRRGAAVHGALPAWLVRLRDGDEPMGVPRHRLRLADDRPLPAVHLRRRRERAGPASSTSAADPANDSG